MGKLSARDRKLAHAAGENVSNVENGYFQLRPVALSQTVLQTRAQTAPPGTRATIVNQVYFTYHGYTQKELIVDYVQFVQTDITTSGTQVAELGLATTPESADGTAKLFTIVAATGNLPNLAAGVNANGVLRQNSLPLGATISPCTHLWTCFRCNMSGGTQPTVLTLNLDLSTGRTQIANSHTAPLAVGEQITGSLLPQSITQTGSIPLLRAIVRV